MDDHTIFKRL